MTIFRLQFPPIPSTFHTFIPVVSTFRGCNKETITGRQKPSYEKLANNARVRTSHHPLPEVAYKSAEVSSLFD